MIMVLSIIIFLLFLAVIALYVRIINTNPKLTLKEKDWIIESITTLTHEIQHMYDTYVFLPKQSQTKEQDYPLQDDTSFPND